MVEMRYRVYTQPDWARSMKHIMCLHTPEVRLPNLMTPEEWARIEAPTLVLWTTHDPGSTVEVGRKLAKDRARLTVCSETATNPLVAFARTPQHDRGREQHDRRDRDRAHQLDQRETPADRTEGGGGAHRLITMFWMSKGVCSEVVKPPGPVGSV